MSRAIITSHLFFINYLLSDFFGETARERLKIWGENARRNFT
jgi:hypothetical protein